MSRFQFPPLLGLWIKEKDVAKDLKDELISLVVSLVLPLVAVIADDAQLQIVGRRELQRFALEIAPVLTIALKMNKESCYQQVMPKMLKSSL